MNLLVYKEFENMFTVKRAKKHKTFILVSIMHNLTFKSWQKFQRLIFFKFLGRFM